MPQITHFRTKYFILFVHEVTRFEESEKTERIFREKFGFRIIEGSQYILVARQGYSFCNSAQWCMMLVFIFYFGIFVITC